MKTLKLPFFVYWLYPDKVVIIDSGKQQSRISLPKAVAVM